MNSENPEIEETKSEYAPGEILGGRYRVISILGQGGMGMVYRVEQIFLRKELAFKTIYKHLLSDTSIRRFQAEAKAASSVEHPNIVKMHDFGLLDESTPYLVMEIVNGQTLGDYFKTHTSGTDVTLSMFIQVCFALAHAHDKHIVHRDIKPNNIMLLDDKPIGTEGSVKILDFGIAKLAQHDEGEIQALTRTGEVFGSPLYMSPEQCQGQRVDHRSDIYSLGCVMFEALTGTTPFVGDTALSTMMMHNTATVPSMKEASLGQDFPPALENIIHKMLSKKPDDRYQNLGHAAFDLAALVRGDSNSILKPRLTKMTPITGTTADGAITITKIQLGLLVLVVASISTVIAVAVMKILTPHTQITSKQSTSPLNTSTVPNTLAKANTSPTNATKKIEPEKNAFELNVDATDEDLEALKDNDALQAVTVSSSSVTDAGLLALQKSKILHLVLNNCDRITTGKTLEQLPYLQDINLNNSGITNEALPHLANLKMLNQVHLQKCDITLDGLKKLSKSQSLRQIYLDKSQFSKDDILTVAKRIPWCTFPEYVSQPYFSATDLNNAVSEGLLQRAPYQPPSKIAHLPLPIQSEIITNMAEKLESENRLKLANELNHRASALTTTTGDKKTLVRKLMTEARTQTKLKGPNSAIPLVTKAYQLLLDTCDHSLPSFYRPFYALTDIPLAAGDNRTVQKYCDVALNYLHTLRPNDTANIELFTRRKASAEAIVNN